MLRRLGSYKRNGQILSLFIVILAVILILAAITMLIGNRVMTRTSVANVADQSALMLASHLGSYGNLLSEKYLDGGTKVCNFSWSTLGKLVVGIILVALAIVLAAYSIGRSLYLIPAAITLIAGVMSIVAPPIADKQISTGITRSFKKMAAKMRFQQTVVYSALSKLVDDPVQVVDIYDFDEDGLVTDTIPRFTFKYTLWAKGQAEDIDTKLSDFLKGIKLSDLPFAGDTLEALTNAAGVYFNSVRDTFIAAAKGAHNLSILSKVILALPTQVVKDIFDMDSPDKKIDFTRVGNIVKNYIGCFGAFGISYDPGDTTDPPSPHWNKGSFDFAKMQDFVHCLTGVYSAYLPTWIRGGYDIKDPPDCDNVSGDCAICACGVCKSFKDIVHALPKCAECSDVGLSHYYNDRFDRIIYNIGQFNELSTALAAAFKDKDLTTIFGSMDIWLPWFYSPSGEDGKPAPSDGDFYSLFYWDIKSINDVLCVLPVVAASELLMGNPANATAIGVLWGQMAVYDGVLFTVSQIIKTFALTFGKYLSMLGPDSYTWIDSRGRHTINVVISDFKVPYIKAYGKNSSTEAILVDSLVALPIDSFVTLTKCVELKDYKGKVYVGISRRDEPVKDTAELTSTFWQELLDPNKGGGAAFHNWFEGYWDCLTDAGCPKTGEVYFGDPTGGRLLEGKFGQNLTSAIAGACYSYKVKKIGLKYTDAEYGGWQKLLDWWNETDLDKACGWSSDACED